MDVDAMLHEPPQYAQLSEVADLSDALRLVAAQLREALAFAPGEFGSTESPSQGSPLNELGASAVSRSEPEQERAPTMPTPVDEKLSRSAMDAMRASLPSMGDDIAVPPAARARGVKALPLTVHAEQRRRVAVLVANMTGTHSLALEGDVPTFVRAHARLLCILTDSVHGSKGFASFVGDRVTASWNTARPAVLHSSFACGCALLMFRRADERPAADSSQLGVRVAVCSGRAVCGVLGTETIRAYTVIGDCVTRAFALVTHCRALGVRALVDEEVHAKAGDAYALRFADAVIFHQICAASASFREHYPGCRELQLLYELLGEDNPDSPQRDEWMYRCGTQAETPYDVGVDALLKGDFSKATRLLQPLAHRGLHQEPDPVVTRLLGFAMDKVPPPFAVL